LLFLPGYTGDAMLRKIYSVINTVRNVFIVVTLGGMVVLCLVQVFLRYFTSANLRPFAWGDEIIRLTSIWVVFLAASIGVREGSHLDMDFFVNKLPPRGIMIFKKIALGIVLVCMAVLVWYGAKYTGINTLSMLQNAPISMAWFYASIPIGCAFLFFDYTLILIYGEHPFAKWQGGNK
jgi:TRAP-type C4-dicarboxylate transport system permease small subunit